MEVKEVLNKYNIEYRLSTKDYIISCLSPEHEDANPSCHVDKITGIFHCWSCGDAGDIYEYFQLNKPNPINRKVEFIRKKINRLMWSKPLQIPIGATMVDYDFRDISSNTLQHFKAFTSDDKDLDMEGRIIFPLFDMHGYINTFVGRYMYSDLHPRYKYYPDNVEMSLYPEIPNANDSIVLVEGMFDLLNLYDNGIYNVVACFGTHIGLVKKRVKRQKNIEKLLPYKYQGISTIYILFDGDEAGRKAAEGLESYIKDLFNVKIIYLDEGEDPGSLSTEKILKLKEMINE